VPCWPFMWTGPPPFWMVPFNREWQSPALTTILVTVTATHNFKNWGCQSADNRRNLNWSRISSCDGQCRVTFSLMSGVHLKMSRHVLESWGQGEISLQQLKIFVLHEALIAGNNQYVPRRAWTAISIPTPSLQITTSMPRDAALGTTGIETSWSLLDLRPRGTLACLSP